MIVDELVDQHIGLAIWIANTFGNHSLDHLRDELQSEALLALAQAVEQYDPAKGVEATSWIGHFIRFRLTDFVRRWGGRRVRLKAVQLSALLDEDENEDRIRQLAAQPADGTISVDLKRLLARLPARERMAVERTWLQGATCKQLAKELGCHESRASQIRQSAMARLRAALSGRPGCFGRPDFTRS